MNEWKQTTLGQFVSLQRGHDLPETVRQSGQVPVMGSFGITGWHNKARANGPGVTVGRSGASIGVVSRVQDDYWPLNTCLFVTDFHGNNLHFAYYLLKTIDLAGMNSGSAQPSLNRNYVYPLPVSIPERLEQDRIADLLNNLDDKIDLNRRMNETLEEMARALFKDWFVDFGPTKAKMAGQAAYLEGELWDLFPEQLDEAGVPEGWQNFQLAEIAKHCKNTISPMKNPEKMFEHYSLPAFDNGQEPVLDSGASIKSNKTVVPGESVLLSKLNPEILRVWLPHEETKSAQVASTEFLAFQPVLPVGRSLLFCLFSSPVFRQTLQGMVTGTSKSHQRVSPPALLGLEVVSGSASVFQAFESAVYPLLKRNLANHLESRTLAQTRDLLLPKLMSGELRVRDTKAQLAEVL